MKRFKFLRTGYKSEYGNQTWKLGKWYTFDGELYMCNAGFHCSKGIYQAFSFVQGKYLAEVEVKGKHLSETDKECWEKMRVVKVWKWTKKDSVAFAIYSASLVLKIYEDKYPNDDRPRKAIEAAQTWLKNPTEKNRVAAWAAGDAAGAAWAAAGDAAWAARAAAGDVAGAAWAARAALAAAWAAGDAAWAALYKKLDKWMVSHLKEMKLVKEI